jgi:DNA-binding transcriptional MerR regulator
VTVKALRHYEEEGLLRPVRVDPQTGYRYYAAEQLVCLTQILQLKDLGFSLNEVRACLDAPESLAALLDARRTALARALAEDVGRLRRLDALRHGLAAGAPLDVVVRMLEPTRALTAREHVDLASDRITSLFETLERDAARAKARAAASPFLLFHDNCLDGDHADVEVCVPVRPGVRLDGVREVEGATEAAAVTYLGPYQQTPSLFVKLAAWCDADQCTVCGPLRETYRRFGAGQRGYSLPEWMLAGPSSEYVTELAMPVRRVPA